MTKWLAVLVLGWLAVGRPLYANQRDWSQELETLPEAGWFYAGQSKNSPIIDFYNYQVIPKTNGTMIVRRRHEFKEPQDHKDLSLIGTFSIDCVGRRIKLIAETDFVGRNLGGNVTYSQNYKNAEWYYPDPGSGDDNLIKYGCDGTLYDANKELADRAGRKIVETYGSTGTTGLQIEIGGCYEKAKREHDRSVLLYCVALDAESAALVHSIEQRAHFPPQEFFSEISAGRRLRNNLKANGISDNSSQEIIINLLTGEALTTVAQLLDSKSRGVVVPPPTSGRSSTQIVEMEQEGGTYVVPVQINGALTLKFIVDSGAADVSIPADVVNTLIRTGTLSRKDFLGPQTYVLADGSRVSAEKFLIRSLKVGSILVKNVTGSVANASGDLLLGQSFLRHFKSWSIDNARHALVLIE